MVDQMKYIPCGVSRCEGTKNYMKLKPEFDDLKVKFDKKLVELENFSKIVEDGQTESSDEVNEVIITNIHLNNECNMLKAENTRLKTSYDIMKTELSETVSVLKVKAAEVLEVKSRYELDEDIIEKNKEVKLIQEDINILLVERQRLKKMQEKMVSTIKLLEEKYNGILADIEKKRKSRTKPKIKQNKLKYWWRKKK